MVQIAAGATQDGQVICSGADNILAGAPFREFTARFRSRFSQDPEPLSAYTYDAVYLMATAMLQVQSAHPKMYLPMLSKMPPYAGVTGNIRFDAKGDLVHPRVGIYTYRKGSRVLVATMSF